VRKILDPFLEDPGELRIIGCGACHTILGSVTAIAVREMLNDRSRRTSVWVNMCFCKLDFSLNDLGQHEQT
jgi:hypothetical protein